MSKKVFMERFFHDRDHRGGLAPRTLHFNTLHLDSDGHGSHSEDSHDSSYATFVPKMASRIKNFDSAIPCKGCGRSFPCYEDNKLTVPSRDYFTHCVEACGAYQGLGLIKKCDKCRYKFLNSNRLGVHRQRHHPEDKAASATATKSCIKRKAPKKTQSKVSVSKRTVQFNVDDHETTSEDIKPILPLSIDLDQSTSTQLLPSSSASSVTSDYESDHGDHHDLEDDLEDDQDYEPFVPKIVAKRIKSYNATVACKACGQQFPSSQYAKESHPSRAYYVHCIKQCPAYARLKLTRKCHKCRLEFIDPKNLGNHLLHHHRQERLDLISRKPDWMSYVTLKNIMTFASYSDTTPCKGCGKLLSCIRRGRHSQYSLEFYVHCIEECPDYARLGLISQCPVCRYVFINSQALRNHKCIPPQVGNGSETIPKSLMTTATGHEGQRKTVKDKIETPSWMSDGIARNIRSCTNYPDVTRCKGCGREFGYRKAGSTNHYSLEYYRHCIEECTAYQRLGLVQECRRCGHKFLNKLAFAHHRC